jgi:hypothetical protein
MYLYLLCFYFIYYILNFGVGCLVVGCLVVNSILSNSVSGSKSCEVMSLGARGGLGVLDLDCGEDDAVISEMIRLWVGVVLSLRW